MTRRLLCLALCCVPALLRAQTLSSVSPNRIVQVNATETGSTRTLVIDGSGITPGANAGEDVARVRFQIRRAGGEWATPSTEGGGVTTNQWSFGLRSGVWFNLPGTLEVRLLVDGRPTNALPITVVPAPTGAPEITEMVPNHFRPGLGRDDVYLFYVRGVGYSDPLSVTVAGMPTSVGRVTVDRGETLVYLPRALRDTPGRYPVVVSTRAGSSYPRYVEVDGPPQVTGVEPGEVVRERIPGGDSVRVKVRFSGAAPTRIRVGSDSLGWVGVAAQEWADSPTAVWVDVPMSMILRATVGHPVPIQLVLSNDSGASTGILSARSDGSTLRIGPAVRTPPAVNRPPPVIRPAGSVPTHPGSH